MSESADSTLEHRLQRNTYLVILVLLPIAGVWSGWRMTLGVALGGALCLLNKNWLQSSLRAILKIAAEKQDGRVPPFTAGKFIFRYYLIACVIGAAVWTGWFHPLGIGIGFAALVGSVMLEAGYQLYLVHSSHQPPTSEE
ncbi:MAG: ATP synthase subunit I [Acidobacteria bacterium]|nr:ATP synthase subunit I [Acidobacteriota bacterium]MBI3424237.1 ATP synthase subunit I [Acidobacteriota bacterium]